MIFYPNAKINLGLAIMRKRGDGYHDLETYFLPIIGLHDELEVEPLSSESVPEEGYLFMQEGLAVDCPASENLIIRTYLLMRERFSGVGPVKILFRKRIPFGAGLGGGSSDAAFMAKALNSLFQLGLTSEQLEELISPLGADCAFFIKNRLRYAEGIGNVFSEAPEDLKSQLDGKWIVLVKPSVSVNTSQAYRGISRREEKGEKGLKGMSDMSLLTNDFERTVFPLFPEIESVKNRLLDHGAFYASMSGSGATVFGLFDAYPTLPNTAFEGCFVHVEQLHLGE